MADAAKAAASASAALPTLDTQLAKLSEDKAKEEAAYEGVLSSLQGETEVRDGGSGFICCWGGRR